MQFICDKELYMRRLLRETKLAIARGCNIRESTIFGWWEVNKLITFPSRGKVGFFNMGQIYIHGGFLAILFFLFASFFVFFVLVNAGIIQLVLGIMKAYTHHTG